MSCMNFKTELGLKDFYFHALTVIGNGSGFMLGAGNKNLLTALAKKHYFAELRVEEQLCQFFPLNYKKTLIK